MCCMTHYARDIIEMGKDQESKAAVLALITNDPRMRCQCEFGSTSCNRKLTQEDLRCDWCRVTDHYKWCYDQEVSGVMVGQAVGGVVVRKILSADYAPGQAEGYFPP